MKENKPVKQSKDSCLDITILVSPEKLIRQKEILGMPEIYKKLVSLMEISQFESYEITDKVLTLEHLFHEYVSC